MNLVRRSRSTNSRHDPCNGRAIRQLAPRSRERPQSRLYDAELIEHQQPEILCIIARARRPAIPPYSRNPTGFCICHGATPGGSARRGAGQGGHLCLNRIPIWTFDDAAVMRWNMVWTRSPLTISLAAELQHCRRRAVGQLEAVDRILALDRAKGSDRAGAACHFAVDEMRAAASPAQFVECRRA